MAATKTEKLDALLDCLRAKPATARALADALGCTKPTAYARLAALEAQGHKLQRTTVREGSTGPKSVAYSLAS